MARPIHVALVAPTLRILGGHSVQAVRLLNGWRDDPEVQLRLLPINPPPPRFLAWLARIKYVRTIVTQLSYWPRLVRELRRADVVHVFSASSSSFYIAPLPAIIVSRLYGKPLIVNYRSGDAEQHLDGSSVARRALKSADLNVVPSSFLRGVFASFDIPAHVIANVAELDRFRFRARSTLRPRLLSTRNLEPLYNVACTIRAFARVQARYPDASLTIVGDGSDGSRLRALVVDLRLRNVTFTGQVPPSDIHRYYADADIYVQTPSFDNMPGSVIEAFASGLPVVSTDVGGVPAILSHGVHGLLAPPDDDATIAARVIEMLENPALARQMADAAFATCRDYEWPIVREQWRETYRSLARDSSKGVEPAMTAQETSREKKTALVTGASSGIGEAFAELLAAEHFDLVITSRSEARLQAVAERLREQHGVRVEVIACDLTGPDAPAALCAEIERRGLTIDALVNCAGFGVPGQYMSASWSNHQAMLQLLVSAPCELTHRLLPSMIARRFGRIVNVASTAGVAALPAGTMYGAAKTMLVRFSESLAREVAPHGVHVTAICPGLTATGFHAAPGMRETVAATPRWLWMEPAAVAREGWAAVSRGRPVAVSGRINRLQVIVFRWVPLPLILTGGRQLVRAFRAIGARPRLRRSGSHP